MPKWKIINKAESVNCEAFTVEANTRVDALIKAMKKLGFTVKDMLEIFLDFSIEEMADIFLDEAGWYMKKEAIK